MVTGEREFNGFLGKSLTIRKGFTQATYSGILQRDSKGWYLDKVSGNEGMTYRIGGDDKRVIDGKDDPIRFNGSRGES